MNIMDLGTSFTYVLNEPYIPQGKRGNEMSD